MMMQRKNDHFFVRHLDGFQTYWWFERIDKGMLKAHQWRGRYGKRRNSGWTVTFSSRKV